MTYKGTLLFLVILKFSTMHAAREWEQFLRANSAYKAGNIQEAFEEYQALSYKGPVVWYNIGMCHLAREQYLDALIAFYKARLGAGTTVNRAVSERLVQLHTHFKQPQEQWAVRYAYRVASMIPLFWAQLLLLLLWYALLTTILLIRSRVISWSLGLLCCAALFINVVVYWVHTRNQAVVIDRSELRVGPQIQFHTIGTIDQASLVNVLQRKEEWCKIKSDQATGWVESSRLAYIESPL